MASKLRSGLGTKISFFAFQDIITSVTGILILMTLILTLYLDKATPVTSEQEQLKQKLSATLDELARTTAQNEIRQTNLLILASTPTPERLQNEIQVLRTQLTVQSNRLTGLRDTVTEREKDANKRADKLGLGDLRERAGLVQKEVEAQHQTNSDLVNVAKELERQREELNARAERASNEHKLWLIPDASPSGKHPVLLTISATNLTCERFNQPGSKVIIPASEAARGLARSLNQWRPDQDYLVFYVRPSGIGLFLQCLETAKRAGFQVGYDAVEENKQILFSAPTGI